MIPTARAAMFGSAYRAALRGEKVRFILPTTDDAKVFFAQFGMWVQINGLAGDWVGQIYFMGENYSPLDEAPAGKGRS